MVFAKDLPEMDNSLQMALTVRPGPPAGQTFSSTLLPGLFFQASGRLPPAEAAHEVPPDHNEDSGT